MNYADIKRIDIANGTGVRVSLFVSGCNHHCENCFNKEAWDFSYGREFNGNTMDTIIKYMRPSYIRGLSLLGGEPLDPMNQLEVSKIVKRVKEEYPEKTIWCYTGFKYDTDIMNKMYKELDTTKEIIDNIDVLVDGKYIESKKKQGLRFRGSYNQRIIDIKESLKKGEIVEYEID